MPSTGDFPVAPLDGYVRIQLENQNGPSDAACPGMCLTARFARGSDSLPDDLAWVSASFSAGSAFGFAWIREA